MKITVVKYEKLHNLGNYENEKVGVEITVGDDDHPGDVLLEARKFVDQGLRDLVHARRAEQLRLEDERRQALINPSTPPSDDIPF